MNDLDRCIVAAYLTISNLGFFEPKIEGTAIVNPQTGYRYNLAAVRLDRQPPFMAGIGIVEVMASEYVEDEETQDVLNDEFDSWRLGHLVNMSREQVIATWPDTEEVFTAIDKARVAMHTAPSLRAAVA